MSRTLAAGAIAALAITATAHANLLVNSSFEEPLTSDGPPFVGFWESFSADGNQDSGPDIARTSTLMPLSGNQSLELIINVPNSFAGVFQDVDGLSGGQEVTFSGWHKSLGTSTGIEIRIEWRDSVNDVEVGRTANFAPMPGADYEMFQLDAVVAEGADTARVVYAIQSFGGATDQLIYVDDVSFIPAPGSMALLGLAGLGLARRRR